jgi:hypothetical protein
VRSAAVLLALAVTVFVAPSLPGAQARAEPFTELWNREILLGDVEAAAEQYEKLYLSSPSDGYSKSLRLKAAFRAGRCFEKLGQIDSAFLAFSWIGREGGDTEDPALQALVSEAAVRAQVLGRRLETLGDSAGIPRELVERSASVDPSADVAIRQVLDGLEAAAERQEDALLALEWELGVRKERLLEHRALSSRMARAGVLLVVPEDFGVSRQDLLQGLQRSLGPAGLLDRVPLTIGGRRLERALFALAGTNLFEARRQLSIAAALLRDNPVVSRWRERLATPDLRGELLDQLARRDLLDMDLAARAALRAEIRRALADAEAMLRERGRGDLAVRNLDRVRDLLDWSTPLLRQDLEVRGLAQRAGRLLELVARGSGLGEVLVRTARENRDRLETILSLADELVSVLAEQARLRQKSALRGRAGAIAACRSEMDRILYNAELALSRGDRVVGGRLLRDAETLLVWVPQLDPRKEYETQLAVLRKGDADSSGRGVPELEGESRTNSPGGSGL